jgi:hypothetical protein
VEEGLRSSQLLLRPDLCTPPRLLWSCKALGGFRVMTAFCGRNASACRTLGTHTQSWCATGCSRTSKLLSSVTMWGSGARRRRVQYSVGGARDSGGRCAEQRESQLRDGGGRHGQRRHLQLLHRQRRRLQPRRPSVRHGTPPLSAWPSLCTEERGRLILTRASREPAVRPQHPGDKSMTLGK